MRAEYIEKKRRGGKWRILSYIFAIFLILLGLIHISEAFGIIKFVLPALPQLIVSFVLLISGILILYHMWT